MGQIAALRVAAAVVAIVATGCGRPAARFPYAADVDAVVAAHKSSGSGAQVPAPVTLEPRPWKVGQWSLHLFRRPGDAKERHSYLARRVIAEDSCGLWIEVVEVTDAHRWKWTVCLRSTPTRAHHAKEILDRLQVLIEQEDEMPPTVIDFRKGGRDARKSDYEDVAWGLVVPSFVETELPRETVDVPAGRVVDALRRTSVTGPGPSLVLWSHPDVPFDALVKSRTSDGAETDLLAFGDTDVGNSVVLNHTAELPPASPPMPAGPNLFFGFGAGVAQFTASANQQSDTATTVSARNGLAMSPTFDFIGTVCGIFGAHDGPDPARAQDSLYLLVGPRWTPFRVDHLRPRSGPLPSRLSFDAALGYAELVDDSNETVARGMAVRLAIDFVVVRGLGWDIAVELSDQLALYNSGEGLRHSLALNLVTQLYMWPRAQRAIAPMRPAW